MAAIIDDLFRYNRWANDRLFALSQGLTDAQLDEKREIGFGSLRNTLFHLLAVEEIWFERWSETPWRPFPTDANGLTLGEMAERLARVSQAREELIDRERGDAWRRECRFQDSKRNEYQLPLNGLLVHGVNHGIHHRAQALYFLKQWGRTVPGGLDYLFFRIARPNVCQEPQTVAAMRQFGLEVATGSGSPVEWDAGFVADYFAYGDWCNRRLLDQIAELDDASLDRSWGLGMDTIRQTVLHVADAERWWLKNWREGPAMYEKSLATTSVESLRELWGGIRAGRGAFLAELTAETAQRVVSAKVGPMTFQIPVIESLVQLCGHGTHHRAQLINMLRRSQVTAPPCDYTVWMREGS